MSARAIAYGLILSLGGWSLLFLVGVMVVGVIR